MHIKNETILTVAVAQAQAGDHAALESVVSGVQDLVHRLSMRMLVNPDDALDATQEILVLVVTRLSTFAGRSKFTTWVYRVATNYLLDVRRANARTAGLTFEIFGADLENGLVDSAQRAADDDVMLNELRVACTMAMLLCLKPAQRVVYVLGDVLGLDHAEAAEILDVAPATYRKRLSRARKQVVAFTSARCGLANRGAKCRCPRRLPAALAAGRVKQGQPVYTSEGDGPSYAALLDDVARVEGDLKTLCLQRATPVFSAPAALARHISQITATRPA